MPIGNNTNLDVDRRHTFGQQTINHINYDKSKIEFKNGACVVVPLAKNKVMYLHKQIETFNLVDVEEEISRDIRFVSIFVKEEGTWKVDFTAFVDAPQVN